MIWKLFFEEDTKGEFQGLENPQKYVEEVTLKSD